MTQNGLTMIKISHFKNSTTKHPKITLAVAKNWFLTSNEASPRVSEITARFPSKFSWSLPFESLNLDSKWRINLKLKLNKKNWTNFVLKIWKFPDFTPMPRVVTWFCHVTAASKFYNPSNLNFDVSDSFGVGKIQTLYGIRLEMIFRTQRWRRNFHLELASTKVGPTPSIILNQIPQLLS